MTRDEVLDHYGLVRERAPILVQGAMKEIGVEELMSTVDKIAPWMDADSIGNDALRMMGDVALFEPDEHGQRIFDRFFNQQRHNLSDEERALAERMSQAHFSIFRFGEKHEAAGLWLEDVLNHDRRIWVMDEGLEASATPGEIVAMRVFEVGPYHMGLGVAIEPGDESLGPCLAAWARRGPLHDQDTLAAQIYSDHLALEGPADEDEMEFLESFAEALMTTASKVVEHRSPLPKKTQSKRSKRRKR